MTALTWKDSGGSTITTANVFTEVTGTYIFNNDDIRSVYVDWGDGTNPAGTFTNRKEYSNYQWYTTTENTGSVALTHTYTATGTFDPVVQVVNDRGFVSHYTAKGASNTELSPYSQTQGTMTTFTSYDGQATGVMRLENKIVKSGIDNSLFNKEGPKDIAVVISPLCSGAELTTISTVELEITALVDSSMLTEVDSTTVGGTSKSVQVISYTGSSLSGKTGTDAIALTGGQVSKILKVVYKNPKYVGASGATAFDQNKAYKNLKIFIVAAGNDGFYYPITYVSAGCPIKNADDPLRNVIMDFSQSRAKASNVSLNSYRYDLGKVWFNPVDQWVASGSSRAEIFGDQTKQLVATSELKKLAYAYNNVRPNGLNGVNTYAYMAFTDSASASWALDNGTDQNKRVDQFLVDEFGRFTDQYHMLRMSADPSTTDKDSTSNVSSIINNQPYIFRMTPGIATGANDSMTKIDYNAGVAPNYTADYTVSGAHNGSGSMISLSGMNTQTFTNMSGTSRDANESILLLFSSKTNKIFLNMNNYGNLLIDKNLQDTTFSTPWKISGISYLVLENSGTKTQEAYWKPIEFNDTTKIYMDYTNTSDKKYESQSNSLSQSGYISYDMPLDWAATNLSGLCGGVGIDDSAATAGFDDLILSGTAITNNIDVTGYGKIANMTLLAASATALEAALSEDDVGAFKYVYIITDDGGGAGVGDNQMFWVASGASNGYVASTNLLSLHYGASIGGTNIPTKGTSNVVGKLRKINAYDIIDGYSKVYISGSTKDIYYPVGANSAWDNTYMVGDTSTGVSQALKTAWDTTDLYALKISLSGAANASEADVNLYPELWNIFDANQGYENIIKEVDDTAYNLNSLPVTSDISVSRKGAFYSAITRKGKVFITRTGDTIENIGFSSVSLGDGTFATYSTPSSLQGQLRKIRAIHGNNVRVYWDEVQKDGTYARYWGMITSVDENHGTGGSKAVISYDFNMMVEEIALIDVNGKLMTNLFPLGGIGDEKNFS